ncbi:tyrosine phosphatase [Xylariomycetidae sp. FL0641]|nr:tyrosine phosphatase [Xylariomycetidae sp. FL0641]
MSAAAPAASAPPASSSSKDSHATLPPPPPLPSPPFLDVPGLDNFRDAGGYGVLSSPSSPDPTTCPGDDDPQQSQKHRMVRRGLLYRAAEPSRLTPAGEAALDRLGVRVVYDLRSELEIARLREQQQQPSAGRELEIKGRGGDGEGTDTTRKIVQGSSKATGVREWPGATRRFVPVFLDTDYSPEALAARFSNYAAEGEQGFIEAYDAILTAGASPDNPYKPFRTILAHLASASATPTPCLVHCTAGKDRTGVVVALALSLCGVPDEAVAHDYALTQLGLRERQPRIVAHLTAPGAPLEGDEQGAWRMVGARKAAMLGTLARIREKHGSVEQCVLDLGLLTPAEIAQLRMNMVVDAQENETIPWEEHTKTLL